MYGTLVNGLFCFFFPPISGGVRIQGTYYYYHVYFSTGGQCEDLGFASLSGWRQPQKPCINMIVCDRREVTGLFVIIAIDIDNQCWV